jgi:uncharacterized membrane protein YhhN
MPTLLMLVYAVLAGASVLLSFVEPFTGIGVLRALPTALLAVAAWPYTRARFGPAIVIAVALGSAGDFFLASQSRAGFIPGLVAFLIGHLAYLWAFTRDLHFTRSKAALLTVALAGVAVLAVAASASIVRAGETGLLAPVWIYVAVLAATMIVCVAHRSPTPWIAAGGIVFVVSDAHIAVNHMILAAPFLPVTLSGYTTYYLAQLLLVHGAARETTAAYERR